MDIGASGNYICVYTRGVTSVICGEVNDPYLLESLLEFKGLVNP